ncbi:MAG: ABC transporter permease [Gemmatimonadota bacterium]|nr:MAG: ABC transporter permease [Gemmatimonadota bacterium]
MTQRDHSQVRGGFALTLFRVLLLLYPSEFRRAYREPLIQAFLEQRSEARYRGFGGRVKFGIEILLDTVTAAYRRYRTLATPMNHRSLPQGHKQSNIPGPSTGTMISSISQDVRYGIRNLTRNPGFSILVVLILAIGIGANVAMFSTMNHALIRPLPYAEPEDLVFGRATFNGNLNPLMSAYDYFDYHERNEVFESVGAVLFGPFDVTITGGDEPEQISGTFVSWDLFPTLGIPAERGRHFSQEEGEPGGPSVAMISGGYWQRRFGGAPDIIGRTITVNGFQATIIGVMPARFQFLYDVDIWATMRRDGPMAGARRWHNWYLVGRLKPDVTIEQAQADMDVISAQLAAEYPETNRDKALLLTNLHEAMTEDYKSSVFLLMAAVGLVLLIACGNVASLLLARGSVRRSELSVRSALGAPRSRLMRQLLTESLVTATMAGILGTVLAIWLQKLVLQFMPMDLPGMNELGISGSMLLFALALSATTGLLFGILPAFRGAQANVVEDIKSSARTTDSVGSRFRSSLVVAQVAVSVILLIGSGLLIRSFASLRGVNPGFETQHLLTAEIRLTQDKYPDAEPRVLFYDQLERELAALPGVSHVALINQLPVRSPGNNIYVYAADRPPLDRNDRDVAYTRTVYPGYFEAMGVPLLRGRDIDRSDVADAPPVLVINETMAQTLFPDEDPIGRQVVVDVGQDVTFDVIGVVGDVRVSGPRYNPRLAMYGSYFQRPLLVMEVAIRAGVEPSSIGRAVRTAVWKQDRDIPVAELSTMEDLIARSVSRDKVMAMSLTMFATVAMSLAAIGIYGVLAYYVSRRAREIGIRMALGARAGDIVRLVLKRGVILVAMGIVLGLVGAYWVTRLIQQMLFEVEPTDVFTFVAVSLFFTAIALVACLVPAWRALRVDPLAAVATE